MAAGKADEKFQPSQTSFESLTTGITYEDPRFHLNLVHKKELRSERAIIDSTRNERLAFYRILSSTTSKTNIIMVQTVEMNSFLWFYAFNVFFKSLPHSFVHFFLASYAPEEHMFVTKMVPICHGLKYLFVLTGFLEICFSTDLILLFARYVVNGVSQHNPWNRCENRVYFDKQLNSTIYCYELEDFAKKFINATNMTYLEYTYITKDNEQFELAQVAFYRSQVMEFTYTSDLFLFLLIWGSFQLLEHYAKRRDFWKSLHCIQWTYNFMNVLIFLDLLIKQYANEDEIPIAKIPIDKEVQSYNLWSTDLDLLAESITAPHIVHVLSSRSTQEIDPTRDSSIMVISNAIFYIFKGLLDIQMRKHCEYLVKTQIPINIFNQHESFYLWPMYFSTFYLGDLFSVIYLVLSLLAEHFVIVVTYLCLVETVIYEWPKLKRWMVLTACAVGGFMLNFFDNVHSRFVLWSYAKGISTMAETFFIYVMYPVGRLVDDYTFHYGIAPTKLRIFSLRLVPVYYMVKLYIMLDSLWDVLETSGAYVDVSHYMWSWALMLLPIILGGCYIIYKYLSTYRMTWTYIFRPVPKWGPRDFSVRQLRKQFDSRFYIGSEVPKLLSRYLISKRDSKVYKVDVRYDFARRSTTTRLEAVRFKEEKEKKNK